MSTATSYKRITNFNKKFAPQNVQIKFEKTFFCYCSPPHKHNIDTFNSHSHATISVSTLQENDHTPNLELSTRETHKKTNYLAFRFSNAFFARGSTATKIEFFDFRDQLWWFAWRPSPLVAKRHDTIVRSNAAGQQHPVVLSLQIAKFDAHDCNDDTSRWQMCHSWCHDDGIVWFWNCVDRVKARVISLI